MAIEDHPKFQDYENAKVALKKATTQLNNMKGRNGERAAQFELSKAQAAFKKLTAEVNS